MRKILTYIWQSICDWVEPFIVIVEKCRPEKPTGYPYSKHSSYTFVGMDNMSDFERGMAKFNKDMAMFNKSLDRITEVTCTRPKRIRRRKLE